MKKSIIKNIAILTVPVVLFLAFIYSMKWWIIDFLCWIWQMAD